MGEVADDRVVVVGDGPGDADLAGADSGDGAVDHARALVEAGGGLWGEADAVAVGDGREPLVGIVGDRADAHGVIVAFVNGQPVVTPPAGVGWGGDERLVPEVVER